MIDDPIAFLRAALDRAEETAKAATPGTWCVDHEAYPETIWNSEGVDVIAGSRWGGEASVFESDADAVHIAAWNPTAVLAQVAADRELIDECDTVLTGWYYEEAKEFARQVLLLRAKAWGWKDEQP